MVYDLQIADLYSVNDETCGYFSRGHHNPSDFVDVVLEQQGVIVLCYELI